MAAATRASVVVTGPKAMAPATTLHVARITGLHERLHLRERSNDGENKKARRQADLLEQMRKAGVEPASQNIRVHCPFT
ncbi:MAG: hypothetical protein WAU00_05595 [Caldilinea sp.]